MRLKNTARYSKRILSLLIVLAMAVSLIMSVSIAASAETTTNEKVKDVCNSVFCVQVTYKDGNYKKFLGGGSSFLINGSTILTCAHVVKPDKDAIALIKSQNGSYNESNIRYDIVVKGQITVEATLQNADIKDDYAILTLNRPVEQKTAVKLGDSSLVSKTQVVYALGFPAIVQYTEDKATYTKDDVTITQGTVGKLSNVGDVDLILHTSLTSPGCSGGPLVDEEGNVVGLNGYTSAFDKDYDYAISVNYLKETLSILGIEYTDAVSTPTEPSETEVTNASEEEETTAAPVMTEPEAPVIAEEMLM